MAEQIFTESDFNSIFGDIAGGKTAEEITGSYENAFYQSQYDYLNAPQGYESIYLSEEDNEDVKFIDTNSEEYSTPKTAFSASGKLLSAHMVTMISGNNFKNLMFGQDRKVLGLPFKYSHLADPLARVYQNTFETDNTCIAFIKFGTGVINKLLFQKMTLDSGLLNGDSSAGVNLANNVFGFADNLVLGLVSKWNDKGFTAQDRRLISFRADHASFMKYAETSLSQVYTLMDLPGKFDANAEDWVEFNDEGFPFYCVKTGSINEAMSNDYAQPDIIDKMNSNAARMRQNYQLYGTYGNIKTPSTGGAFSWTENIATGWVEQIAEDIASDEGVIGSVASVFMSTNKGSMSYYGKIWADSKSERSITLSFKFRSVYGNKYDIFRNVYFPFLLLHTASIPKQDGRFSYKEPFMIEVDFPGWFNVNCGIITRLSWTRGGDQQLFTAEGLPLEMTVTADIEDLYPIEIASKGMETLAYNYGLLSFLENMAGIHISQVKTLYNVDGISEFLEDLTSENDMSISSGILAYRNFAFKNFLAGDDFEATMRANNSKTKEEVADIVRQTSLTQEEYDNLSDEDKKLYYNMKNGINNDFVDVSDYKNNLSFFEKVTDTIQNPDLYITDKVTQPNSIGEGINTINSVSMDGTSTTTTTTTTTTTVS